MAKQYIRKDETVTAYYKDRGKNKLHRLDGPAIIRWDGDKIWYVNDKLHRLDGPAAEYGNGDRSWWINGEHIFTIDKSEKIKRRMK